ncbi:MAG: hypothetical protein ACTSWM_00555 [Alphaproteobacteria bacterium]
MPAKAEDDRTDPGFVGKGSGRSIIGPGSNEIGDALEGSIG